MSVTADPATVPAFRPARLVPGLRAMSSAIPEVAIADAFFALAGVPLDTPLQPHHLAQ